MNNENNYTKVTQAAQVFPYFVLNGEKLSLTMEYKEEILEILKYYDTYENGSVFFTEGSAGSYVPSAIRYCINKSLINKEARFMFSHLPDVNLSGATDASSEEQIETYKKIVDRVIKSNNFGQKLLQAAKDCFIGKRVACLVDMSERSGIMLHFYTALEFYYETDPRTGEMIRFISFENVSEATKTSNRRYVINRYVLEKDRVFVSSGLYDGAGKVIETYVETHATDLKKIPVVLILNGGILKNKRGVSDLEGSIDYESGYSRLANAEIDANRKGMNPIRYTVDMNPRTTKQLPIGAGAFWDLEHNQNLWEPKPQVGQLAPAMNHTEPVKASLDRLRGSMYDSMDIPDISKDGLLSGITSFKALKALYYPLMNRSDEKLIVWKPAIAQIFRFVIELACLNENVTKQLYFVSGAKIIDYEIEIVENYALIDDETEEKQVDMEEIAVKARSRYSYLKKWRGEELKTDDEIEEELLRIAEEENMMDTLSMNAQIQNRMNDKETEQEVERMAEEEEVMQG